QWREFPGVAGGRGDSGGWRVWHAGRAEPHQHWPAQCRWDSGRELQSGRRGGTECSGLLCCVRLFSGGASGWNRSGPRRIHADGTLDTRFDPGAYGGYGVNSLAVQADGKILVGGNFTTLDGQSRSGIGRLNADGALDPTFNPGADSRVSCLAVQADGKILVG